MDMPKVNIAVAASAVVAIVSTVGGGIWYASQQASIIENLTEQVNTLTIENNATDRTNLIRDVEENSERIDDIIDYIVELEEEGGRNLRGCICPNLTYCTKRRRVFYCNLIRL